MGVDGRIMDSATGGFCTGRLGTNDLGEGVLLEVARAKGRRAKPTGGTVHRATIYGQLTSLSAFAVNVYVREGPVVEANAGHRSF